jgi:hypothetical protein
MTPGGVAILSTCGLILVALIGAIVELRKARVSQRAVEHEMKPNSGGSLRDAVNQVAGQVTCLDGKLDGVVERLVRVETRQEYQHPPMRRAGDGG